MRMPTGTFMRKHQFQEKLSASHPPRVGPTTGPTTTAIPKTANPWPRLSGGNESARMDCAKGTIPPPANPWKTRKISISETLSDSPHINELIVNRTKENRKNRFLLKRLAR